MRLLGGGPATRDITRKTFGLLIGATGALIIVSPSVVGSGGAGTLASPFSLEYALTGAGGAIASGATVLLRGNADPSVQSSWYKVSATAVSGSPRDSGYTCTTTGVTFKAYTGEFPVIADPIDMSAGWTVIDAGRGIYESNFTVAGSTHFVVGSFLGADGQRHLLAAYPYNNTTGLAADISTYDNGGAYYCGPGIVRMSTGKVRVRLQNLIAGGATAPSGGFTYPTSTNPATANLILSRMDYLGLTVTGSNNTFDGIEVSHFALCVKDNGDSNNWKNCTIRHPYVGVTLGDGSTVRNAGTWSGCTFDGMLRAATTYMAYGDIKNGVEPLVLCRNQSFQPNNTAINGKMYGCTAKDAFDFSVILTSGWEFGSYGSDGALTGAAREAAAWSNANIFNGIWDDTFQMTQRCQLMKVHHNWFFGAGVSRDGASSSVNLGNNWPAIHHNVFSNLGKNYLYNKNGRDAAALVGAFGDARYTEEGRANMFVISSHGEPAGTDYRFHWWFYHNTVFCAKDIGNGPQVLALSSWGNAASNTAGGRTMVLNNVFVDNGWWNANQPTTDEGRFRVFNTSRLYMARADNIFDGNVHCRVAPTGAGVSFFFTQIDSSGATAETLSSTYGHAGGWDYGYVTGLQAFRPSSPLYTDATAFYTPGWAASDVDIETDPASFNAADFVNVAANYGAPYVPLNSQMFTGAATITALGLVDMPAHIAWRGALAPVTADTDAAAITARMTSPTGRYQFRISQLVTDLKAAGVWSKLTELWVFDKEGSAPELINWIAASAGSPATLSNAPTYTSKLGYQGNGTTSELLTGVNATAAFAQDSAHMGVYVETAGTGVALSTGNGVIQPGSGANNCFMRLNNAGSATINCPATGHFIASRTASNLTTFYRNGASVGTLATASAAPTGTIRIMSNQGGTYFNGRVTFVHAGSALTSTEAAALSTAFANYIASA